MLIAGALALPAAAAATTPPVSESFSPGSVAAGGITTLTFTIDNSQDSLPHSISFDDQLPAGIHLVGTPSATTPACVGAPNGQTSDLSFTGTVAPQSVCTISAAVQGVQAGSWDNATTVMVDASPVPADATLDVVAPPSISAAFRTTLLGLDGTTSLSFTITDPNSAFALSGVGFTDSLPAGLVIVGLPAASNTCAGTLTAAAGSDSIGLSGGQLPPGSSCTVSATVAAIATGALSSTTTQVTSVEGGTGNTTSAALTVIGAPTVAFSSPAAGHTYAFDQPLRASYACADDPSGPGVKSCTGSVANGALIDTGKAGLYNFTVTATSLDGGVATDIVFYSVAPDNRFTVSKPHVSQTGAIGYSVKVPGPGRITVLETPAGSRLAFARGAAVARRAGSVRLTLKPSARGRQDIQRRHRLRLTVTVGYTPTGGTRRTTRLTLSLT